MGKLSKRQRERIKYYLREKEERRKKQELIHNEDSPKYIDRHIPFIRRLAPNLDQLLIVASFVSPPLKTGLIDRFLVLTEVEEIRGIVCLNKVDLLNDPAEAQPYVSMYRSIGYDTLETSVTDKHNINLLMERLRGKRTALAGHSGVGKSSLLNTIAPDLNIRVDEVSRTTNKGRHTTTQIKVYQLNGQTEVIDLPGIKVLDFIDISRKELRYYYPEFLNFSAYCKFRDCLHVAEIECAVKHAVEEGHIHPLRYKSYKKFLESLA